MITIKNEHELELMRISSRLTAEAFLLVWSLIKPNVTTEKLDREIEKFIRSKGATPSFKGLYGFPASACISVNEEVVHGIPSSRRVLREGDIVSVDIGVKYKGFHGDSAFTFPVGDISPEKKKLLRVTIEALYRGIDQARSNNRLQDISHAIQSHAESYGYGVVRELVGHGIGKTLHEEPQVPNFGKPHRGPLLRAGMTLAIEPMINMGTRHVLTLDDGWTVVTQDRLPSAHYEHTIIISNGKPEIITENNLKDEVFKWPKNNQ
ncbi:MAG TPA: type I methionyl aminopeptidase [Caldithrix sp.]|nr:type I methionyl aminopeptidase [Caldithrix sp.]